MRKSRKILLVLAFAALPAMALAYNFQFDSDVPQNIQKQILDDLAFIKSVDADAQSDLHKQIFGRVNGDDYLRFFDTRVTGIGMDACGGGNAVACVIPFYDPSKMWLTENYVKFSHPSIARTMVIFHESRHTETQNGNWGHATCPRPFLGEDGKPIKSIWTGAELAGEPACDRTPFGSYGSSMIMLKNISKFCKTCSEKVKMDAGIYADDQFKRVIDERARKQIIADLYRQ